MRRENPWHCRSRGNALRPCAHFKNISSSGSDPLGGLYPNAAIADCAQYGCNFAIASIKPGAADDFFVFRKNIPAYAQLHVGVQNGHQKYLRWLSLRTEQGGNQDVGIEDNPDHCSWGC